MLGLTINTSSYFEFYKENPQNIGLSFAQALRTGIGLSLRNAIFGLEVNLGRVKGRRAAFELGVFEVSENVELLELMDRQTKEIEAMLFKRYGHVKPVERLMSIPGVGFLSAATLYAEICDIGRFSSAENLAHYAGLVPTVRQSGEHSFTGKETRVVMLGLSGF